MESDSKDGENKSESLSRLSAYNIDQANKKYFFDTSFGFSWHRLLRPPTGGSSAEYMASIQH
jgi:hypothetical protein